MSSFQEAFNVPEHFRMAEDFDDNASWYDDDNDEDVSQTNEDNDNDEEELRKFPRLAGARYMYEQALKTPICQRT